jgi:hypothetical protein
MALKRLLIALLPRRSWTFPTVEAEDFGSLVRATRIPESRTMKRWLHKLDDVAIQSRWVSKVKHSRPADFLPIEIISLKPQEREGKSARHIEALRRSTDAMLSRKHADQPRG